MSILLSNPAFSVTVYGKDENVPASSKDEATALLRAADDVPLFLGEKGKWVEGWAIHESEGSSLSFESSIQECLASHQAKTQNVYAILGPSLGFSHRPAKLEDLKVLIEKGYRPAAKRTDGVPYLDLPLLVFVSLRKAGLAPEHILLSDDDTFENPLLFSASKGDKEKNAFLASLLK